MGETNFVLVNLLKNFKVNVSIETSFQECKYVKKHTYIT